MNVSCFPNNFTPMSRLPFSVNINTIHLETTVKNLNIIFEFFSIIPHIQPIVMFSLIYLLNHRLTLGKMISHLVLSSWSSTTSGDPTIAPQSQASNRRSGERKVHLCLWENFHVTFLFAYHWPKLNHMTIASCMIDWKLSPCLLIKIRVLASFFLEKLSLKVTRWNQTGKHPWQGAETSVECWSMRWVYNLNLIREKTWIITQNERLYTK